MQHAMLGSLRVSRVGLGTMSMAGTLLTGGDLDDAESVRAIHRALELGVTHIDTAESYGPFHSEEVVGQALEGRRDQAVIATKFGILSHLGDGTAMFDSSPANIRTAVEGSLKRLRTDRIDLYYQHRVDRNTPIEETIGTVAELVAEAASPVALIRTGEAGLAFGGAVLMLRGALLDLDEAIPAAARSGPTSPGGTFSH